MDLLERYLQAVGQYLPVKGKDDTLAELRANLMAEIEGREEELGRPLNEAEVSSVLAQHGRPVIVASRYLPQQSLIGPGLFPLYWVTLIKSFPLVLLAYTVAQVANFLFGGGGAGIMAAIAHFPYVAFTFWGVVTLGFAVFEFAQGRFFEPIKWSQAWDPRELKERTPEPKGKSFASRVADLIVSVLMIAWLLAVPNHPFLVLGPGASLNRLSLGLTPDWHIFYWQIVGLLVLMLPVKAMALLVAEKWRKGLDLTAQAIGILVLVVLVQARSYLVPLRDASNLPSLANLAQVNYSVNLGFKIVLAVSLVKFLWDIWEAILGSRSKATGFVGVF